MARSRLWEPSTSWAIGIATHKVVIAPIFDGSGMKTKVAEALMYGKRIIGTREAFSGYEDIAEEVGWVCNTKEEFVAALRTVEGESYPAFRPIP